jgi:hypothetical protein
MRSATIKWGRILLLALAVPLSLVLALVPVTHCDIPTPGQVGLRLLPPFSSEGCCDLRPQGFIILVDTVSWLVVLTALYGLIRKNKKVLLAVAIPLSFAFALACDGFAFQASLFTPGVSVWRLLRLESSAYHPIALGLALLIDTACWLGIFVAALKLIPRLRRNVE